MAFFAEVRIHRRKFDWALSHPSHKLPNEDNQHLPNYHTGTLSGKYLNGEPAGGRHVWKPDFQARLHKCR